MFRLICAVLLLSAAAVRASTTAAWKVPVELYASLSEDGSKKLAAPPAASAFFQPGDELWDIAKPVMRHSPASLHDRGEKPEPWPGEWLVWNARSGMIVARGSEIDLLLLDQTLDVFEKIPLLLCTKFELVQGPGAETRTLSLISKNGMKSHAKLQDLAVEMSTAYEPGPGSPVDLDLAICWSQADARWELSTKIAMPHGQRARIAMHAGDGDSWELFLTASKEWFHGVTYDDIRWKEQESRVVRWPKAWYESSVERFSDQLQVGVYRIPFDFLDSGHDDPFGKKTKEAWTPVAAPSSLSKWIRGDATDITPLLASNGVRPSFAGYDHRRQLLVVLADPFDHELLQQLFHSSPGCHISRGIWTELSVSSDSWGIASSSGGGPAVIHKSLGDRKLRFEVKSTLALFPMVDCSYSFDIVERKDAVGSLSSQATLRSGVPQVIGSYGLPGMEEAKVSLTATRAYP